MVGLAVPLVANKGHVIALGRVAPMLPLPLETLRQTDEGIVLVGDSHEIATNDALDPAVIGAIARRALRILPALASARVDPDVGGFARDDARRPAALRCLAHPPRRVCGGLPQRGHACRAHAFTLGPAIADGRLPDALAPFRCETLRSCTRGCLTHRATRSS